MAFCTVCGLKFERKPGYRYICIPCRRRLNSINAHKNEFTKLQKILADKYKECETCEEVRKLERGLTELAIK